MRRNVYLAEGVKDYQLTIDIVGDESESVLKKNGHAKRVNIVSVKLVKESSLLYKNRRIRNPADAAKLVQEILESCDREQLLVCCLDTKNQPTAIHTVSIGSLNSSIVHPREVFKVAVLSNAASIILFHNHPSGDPAPSKEDIDVTARLKECGKILGIELLDHGARCS
ncbi:JAB domain-containing protein [Aneurinibacillus aneurinilyticus]|uniref:Putative DNA repair protein RadC n=1 Tax=Aneurinibacillus aneurinilyticus ATCC 12856 TaxID=649747 RepID=U1Y8L3_ANEAE|nr:JAB domain-containing protein [Aneurinibacillus aneurinilyticus]ERI07181.1 putative DNA repair protein RadC [Aneurinibacillus aneurinilyticus ATCC 12856]MED0705268.1 JAB domain-containing protein [Aneurinibacillus aneurinilyticus]MED0722484.1 JAB domain-containing protein [Aneurinibacillus aneurinilyticus]MED0733794.1 JAB domain-containing protein [Aneurinibacillus aneurinilyticus]MED0739685.1 JAB domain-containing protein [Aneurinibacillus aneurinilyticus]